MTTIASKEERKIEAIKCLEQLKIYKPYIRAFKDENKVCVFEQFGGYYDDQRGIPSRKNQRRIWQLLPGIQLCLEQNTPRLQRIRNNRYSKRTWWN